jgi:hypothetical protein
MLNAHEIKQVYKKLLFSITLKTKYSSSPGVNAQKKNTSMLVTQEISTASFMSMEQQHL